MKSAIGVVIPTRNSATTLEATLLSLLSQREVSPTIIAVDSDSTDGTQTILESWGINTLYVPPGNMYQAINVGIAALECRWITWVNSDDILYPDALTRLVSAGDTINSSIVYGECDYCDAEGRFLFGLSSADPTDLLALCGLGILGFGQHAAIFRRTLWCELGGLREQFKYASDLDFFMRALSAGMPFAKVGSPPVALFRIHQNQLSQSKYDEMEAEKRVIASTTDRSSISRFAALWRWRLRNSKAYVIRALRKRVIRPVAEQR